MRLIALVSLLLSATLGAQQLAGHALDPLSANEITRTVALLRASGHLTPQSRFGTITVQPQPKSAPNARAARVVGHDWSRNEGFLAIVDLDHGRVSSWTVVDSEPPMRLLNIRRAEEIAHADARWVAALRARGIDTSRVGIILGLPERAKLPRVKNDRVVPAVVWLRDGIPDGDVITGQRALGPCGDARACGARGWRGRTSRARRDAARRYLFSFRLPDESWTRKDYPRRRLESGS
jgi:Cu2+-containing amine oxidase